MIRGLTLKAALALFVLISLSYLEPCAPEASSSPPQLEEEQPASAGRSDALKGLQGHCSLYLAPSSIHGAGLGVFAGRNFSLGDRIGEPGLGIQLTDPYPIYDEGESITEFGWNSMAVGGDGVRYQVAVLYQWHKRASPAFLIGVVGVAFLSYHSAFFKRHT